MTKSLKANTALTPADNAPPPELAEQMMADAGQGVSTRAEDQLIPLLRILQSNSPQCDKRGAGYIDGAEPGHFLLRGAVEPIRDGTVGIEVIPCGMEHSWVEWMPGRQGFVARHANEPDDVETRVEKDDGGRARSIKVRKSSANVIQDSRDYFLLIAGAPFMWPCTSTLHTFAREWNSYFNQIRHPPVTGKIMPSYARRYRLRTVVKSNAKGHWFTARFDDLGWVSMQGEYQAAKALNDIVKRGAARVEAPFDDGAASPAPARQEPTASASRPAPGVA